MTQNLAPPPRPRHEPPWLAESPVVPPRPRTVTASTVLWLADVTGSSRPSAGTMFLPQSNVWFAANSGWGGRR